MSESRHTRAPLMLLSGTLLVLVLAAGGGGGGASTATSPDADDAAPTHAAQVTSMAEAILAGL